MRKDTKSFAKMFRFISENYQKKIIWLTGKNFFASLLLGIWNRLCTFASSIMINQLFLFMIMKTTSRLLKIAGLSLLLIGLAPLATIPGTTAVAQSGEDMEAVRQRLMARIDELRMMLAQMESELEGGGEYAISQNNTRILKEAVVQKATELKALGGSPLQEDMQSIIDAVNNSGNSNHSRDEMESLIQEMAMRIDDFRWRVQSATSMEQLAELEAEEDNLVAMMTQYYMVFREWLKENKDDENAFNTKNVSRYYETIWNYSQQLNYNIFKAGDLFIAKGLIFKVLDAEKKTCQLGRGEGNWWPEDYLAAEEPSSSDCWDSSTSTITLPDQVYGYTLTVIGEAAFNQEWMRGIVLNESLEEIGKNALATYGLKEVFIPRNVRSIGLLAFSQLRANMQKFEVDAQNPYLHHTSDMKGVVETATNTLIAACQDLEIPDNITALGPGVFYYCDFENKTLPLNLQKIGSNAFQYCKKMKTIALPESLKEIGDYAFSYSGLQEIALPASLTTIGKQAFSNCKQLATIHAAWDTPFPINEEMFGIEEYNRQTYRYDWITVIYDNAALYVPQGRRDVYAATEGWSLFQKILEEGEIDLDPFEGYEKDAEPDDLKDAEDLSGVVINDIYYAMDTENGDGYDEVNDCLVFNSSLPETNEDELDNSSTLPEDFYGICFQVPTGTGRVTIDVETAGSRTIGVKIGSQPAKRYAPNDRQQIVVEYSVSAPTYIYVYPSNQAASARRRVAAGENSVKIYGMKWEKLSDEPSGIVEVAVSDSQEQWYNLNGQRIVTPLKGIYILNGRKLVVD